MISIFPSLFFPVTTGTLMNLSLDLTNTYTTLTQGILNNDFIVVRVTARGDWTGFIDAMSVTF